MRHSQYRLPGDAGDAELAIFVGIGGGVQQNVDRWVNQFSNEDGSSAEGRAQTSKQQINGFEVTFVDVSGTYNPGTMGTSSGPMNDYRMLGAVIETGSEPWFLKLTGPADTVGKWEESFKSFVESVRAGS